MIGKLLAQRLHLIVGLSVALFSQLTAEHGSEGWVCAYLDGSQLACLGSIQSMWCKWCCRPCRGCSCCCGTQGFSQCIRSPVANTVVAVCHPATITSTTDETSLQADSYLFLWPLLQCQTQRTKFDQASKIGSSRTPARKDVLSGSSRLAARAILIRHAKVRFKRFLTVHLLSRIFSLRQA